MPRKSSFLMGFESGAGVFEAAKRRQMAAKQLQLQTRQQQSTEEYRRRQQTLAEDTASQRAKYLDVQIRAASANFKHQQEVRNRATVGMKALADWQQATTGWVDPDDPTKNWHTLADSEQLEKFLEGEKKHAVDIVRGGLDVRNSAEVWSQKSFWQTAIGKSTKAAETAETTDNLNSLNHRNSEREKQRDLISKANKLFPGLNLDPGDLGNAVEAEAKLMELELAGIYDPYQVDRPTHTGADVGDINNDGVVDARDILAAKGDVYAKLLQRQLDATTAKEIRTATLAMKKFQFEQGMREQTAIRTEQAKKFTLGSPGAGTATMDDFVFSGISIGDIARSTDSAFSSEVLKERTKAISKAKLKSTPTLERIRLSGASDKYMLPTQLVNLNKAFTVKRQIKTVEQFMDELETGPKAKHLLEIQRWYNDKTGKKVAKLAGLLNAIMPNLARGIYGEVGVLTEEDINNYKRTFVSLDNDPDVNRFLFNMTKKMVDSGIVQQLNNATKAGQNVSGFYSDAAEILGEQAPGGLGVTAPAIRTLRPEVQKQLEPIQRANPGMGMIGPQNMRNILAPARDTYEDMEDAQTAVNLNSLATGNTKAIMVEVKGIDNPVPIIPDSGEDMADWLKAFDMRRSEDKSGGQAMSEMFYFNEQSGKIVPFIFSPEDVPEFDIDKPMPRVDMGEHHGAATAGHDFYNPEAYKSNRAFQRRFGTEGENLDEAEQRKLWETKKDTHTTNAPEGWEPGDPIPSLPGATSSPQRIKAEDTAMAEALKVMKPEGVDVTPPVSPLDLMAEPVEVEVPKESLETEPGTVPGLPPLPKDAFEMQRRKEDREKRKKMLEGKDDPEIPTLPGSTDKPEQRRKNARERRLQLIALKPIAKKLVGSQLDTGKGVIEIIAYDDKGGVLVIRDGEEELITWDDFEELMDKLGYLK